MKCLQIFRREKAILGGILMPWRIWNRREIEHEVVSTEYVNYFTLLFIVLVVAVIVIVTVFLHFQVM